MELVKRALHCIVSWDETFNCFVVESRKKGKRNASGKTTFDYIGEAFLDECAGEGVIPFGEVWPVRSTDYKFIKITRGYVTMVCGKMNVIGATIQFYK